jgi:excisionase family DNA binding protein
MTLQPYVTERKVGGDVTPRAYRIDDFCRSFGVGRTTVYALLKNGTLRSVKIGSERRQPCSKASFRSAGQNSTHAEEYVFVTLDRRNPESGRCKSAFAGPRFLLVVSTSLLTFHYVHSRSLGEPSAFFPAQTNSKQPSWL